jgi:hypothetical protein
VSSFLLFEVHLTFTPVLKLASLLSVPILGAIDEVSKKVGVTFGSCGRAVRAVLGDPLFPLLLLEGVLLLLLLRG